VTRDGITALLILAFGGVLTFHCPRAALREVREGVARGRKGDYPRATMPVHFWTTIVMTAAAGLLGIIFMTFAIGTLIALQSIDL
jgi:hypothetical protein